MAFDLLQNKNIPVKLLIGAPGVGKDLLMLIHALDLI
jgi:predicted ribonuclease YlaK